MDPPPALLFDLDGCLVDSLPSIARCWAETLTAFGYPAPAPADLRRWVGPPAALAAEHFTPGAGPELRAEVLTDYRNRSERAEDVPAFDGVPEMIAGLRERGIRLAIATSKSLQVAGPQLGRIGLDVGFDVIEGTRPGELGVKAVVVARALERLAPATALGLVGDRREDVDGAHANGLPAFGATWGYGQPGELAEAGAELLLAAPRDLLTLDLLSPLTPSSAPPPPG